VTNLSIGVDTGGTFTDLVLLDRASSTFSIYKLPTTPDDPARGILAGIAALLEGNGYSADMVELLVHGTTLATNAVLQRRYAKTGMLVTKGFRDVLEIGRQRRPAFYNLDVSKPEPPVTRDCIHEVSGRLNETGAEVAPLHEDGVRAAVSALRETEVEAIAVCFMHAYANPAHEEAARAIVREMWPEVFVCTSTDVLREFREFERFSSASVNASLLPVIDRYLEKFSIGLQSIGIRPAPLVMQSNGGSVSVATVRTAPINTFLSGPAGGVVAAANLATQSGYANLIAFDMGGTSTDVSLIRGGKPTKRSLVEMAGFPVRVPTLDIHTIGAGGGSIAWVDPGGLLKVGPQSAGADPGPALYGRGGTDATVTDANIVLGRLAGSALIGGAMTVFPDKSCDAVKALGDRAALDDISTAAGIIEIVNVNMMGAVRVVSVERGEDPREYALAAFGGAGPLHAAEVARETGIKTVILPLRPGLLSAVGLLDADRRGDFSVTRLLAVTEKNLTAFEEGVEILNARGADWCAEEALEIGDLTAEYTVDLRYQGQAFEITLPLESSALNRSDLAPLLQEFHRRHKALNGYDMAEQSVEIVTMRLGLAVPPRPLAPPVQPEPIGNAEDAIVSRRDVWFGASGFVDTPIFDRSKLGPGHRFAGPAIVEQTDTTTVVPPDAGVEIDTFGNLLIKLGDAV
jgi:N-methylhydantoinase A